MIRRFAIALALCAWTAATALAASPTVFTSGWGTNPNAALFNRHDADPANAHQVASRSSWIFNIPQVIQCANGDLLAFAEMRKYDIDEGCGDIQFKRSTDGGATWGTLKTAVHQSAFVYDTVTPNYDHIKLGSIGKLSNGTLVLVYVRATYAAGTFPSKYGAGNRTYVTLSTDNGQTWGAASEITSSVGLTHPTIASIAATSVDGNGGLVRINKVAHGLSNGWKVRITGDAAGDWIVVNKTDDAFELQGSTFVAQATATYSVIAGWNLPVNPGILLTTAGTYQNYLILPCDHRWTVDTAGTAYSHCLRTNDGVTFAVHGRLDANAQDLTDNADSNECTIAESTGGVLHMNIRNTNGTDPKKRYWSRSTDQGITWTDIAADANLPGTSCNGSLIATTDGTMYLTCPKEAASGTRGGLTVYKFAATGDATPAIAHQRIAYYANQGFSAGYSSLVAIDSTTLGLVTERAHDTAYTNVWYQHIEWCRFPMAWVDDGSTTGALTNTVYPTSVDFQFNEATSGAPDSAGRQIVGHGYDLRGYGQASSNATYSGDDGFVFGGSGAGPLLSAAVASRTTESVLDPGLGSIIYEWEYQTVASGSGTRIFFDDRNAAGIGVTISLNISNRPSVAINDGTTALTIVPTSGSYEADATWYRVTVCYVRGGVAGSTAMWINGTRVLTTTDNLSSSVAILGSTAWTVGRQSTTDAGHLPAMTLVRRFRVTHDEWYSGAAPTALPTEAIGALDTKTSLASYTGFSTTTAPATAPTATARLCWLAPIYDGGRSGGTDYYGNAYDAPAMPPIHGQGISALKDVTGGRIFKGISDETFAAQWWERDSVLGLHLRCAKFNSTSQTARFQETSAAQVYDDLQTDGTFTVMGMFRIGMSGAATILDNCSRDTANPGFTLYRNGSNKLAFLLSSGGTAWFDAAPAAWPTITTDQWYFIAVAGNVTTLDLYYAPITGPGAPVLTTATQQVMSDQTGAHASTLKLTLGTDTDQGQATDLRFRDLMIYSTNLSASTIAAAAGYMAPPANARPRMSIGIGLGLSDARTQRQDETSYAVAP